MALSFPSWRAPWTGKLHLMFFYKNPTDYLFLVEAPPGSRVYYFGYEYIGNPGSHFLATANVPLIHSVDKIICGFLKFSVCLILRMIVLCYPYNRTIVGLGLEISD